MGLQVVCEVQGSRDAFCPTLQAAVLQVLGSLVCQVGANLSVLRVHAA